MNPETKPVPPADPVVSLTATGFLDVSKVALRVAPRERGGDVDKAEVARLLGCESDAGPFLHWRLRAPDSVGSDLDGQIAWILERLTPDLERWKTVQTRYRVDVYCGLFLEQTKRGLGLLPRTLTALAAREIEWVCDVFVPTPEKRDA
ncbi:MAG TPA: DUF4279 domain-containing protein [Opitutaceae bacterium]|nr:DUF4279 domain-containing protein [Opitutaceae bacterium]